MLAKLPVPVAFVALTFACSPAGTQHGGNPAPATTTERAPIVLSVVATSDLHGYVDRTVVLGGFVDNLRAVRKADGGMVLVDAGDMFQGTIAANATEGAAVIRAYNALGYDAATIGNHEFDYGPQGPAAIPRTESDNRRGALVAAAKLAHFPLLASNFIDKATGQPVRWPGILPSTVVDTAGVRVGIVGASTSQTLETTIASNVDDLRMAPIAETLEKHARELRSDGAQVVVALVHAGGDCERFDDPDDISSCKPSELFEVAKSLEPGAVDVLVGAHTHRAVAHRVNGIPVIQSYAYGRAFGRVDISVDPSTGRVEALRIHPPQPICQESDKKASTCTPGDYEGSAVRPSDVVAKAVAEDLASAEAKRAEPLGVELSAELSNKGKPSSPLGDWVATWMLDVRPQADIALMNAGGLRASLPPGPLRYGAFYEMFPFDNRFASAQVTGAALEQLIRSHLQDGDGFSVAGAELRAWCEDGSLQVELRKEGKVVRDDEQITLLLSDYLAMTSRVAESGIPKERFTFEDDPAIREAIVAHLRDRGGTIPASPPSAMNVPDRWPVTCE